jgi:hypothetical protein
VPVIRITADLGAERDCAEVEGINLESVAIEALCLPDEPSKLPFPRVHSRGEWRWACSASFRSGPRQVTWLAIGPSAAEYRDLCRGAEKLFRGVAVAARVRAEATDLDGQRVYQCERGRLRRDVPASWVGKGETPRLGSKVALRAPLGRHLSGLALLADFGPIEIWRRRPRALQRKGPQAWA